MSADEDGPYRAVAVRVDGNVGDWDVAQVIREATFDALWDRVGGTEVSVRPLAADVADLDDAVDAWVRTVQADPVLAPRTKETYVTHVQRFRGWLRGEYEFPGDGDGSGD
jgi:hypothetical protein